MAQKVPYVNGVLLAVKGKDQSLSGAQLRAARALLALSAAGLASLSMVSLRTIRRAEQEHGATVMTAANAARLIEVLEKRGVIFSNDGSSGVSLRSKPKPIFGEPENDSD